MDVLEDFLQEAEHDQTLGGVLGYAAGTQVKQMLVVDAADGTRVRALDLGRLYFQERDRVRVCAFIEYKVTVGLIRVGARGARGDDQIPEEDRVRLVFESALIEQVGIRLGSF